MDEEREFTFDVKMFAQVKVKARSVREARERISERMDGNEANFGCWENGDPILATVSLDGEHDLIEDEDEPTAHAGP